MSSLRKSIVPVLGMTVALLAWSAKAETVAARLWSVSPWPGVWLTTNGLATSPTWEYGGVGQLQWDQAVWRTGDTVGTGSIETHRASSFWTYCVQAGPANSIPTGTQVFKIIDSLQNTPDVLLGAGADAAAKADKISELFAAAKPHVADPANPDFATLPDDYKVALQLAIWEVVYDYSALNTYASNAYTTGNFQANSLSAYGATAWTEALALLNSNILGRQALSGLQDIDGGTHQNQSIVVGAFGQGDPVPLPGTAGAVLGLLSMTGLLRRKRA